MTKDKESGVNKAVEDPRIQKIAEKLKKLRKDAGFSNYEEFAWENDIGRAQYWRIEKGANFTIVTLLKILDAHKISLKDFFSDSEI